MLTAQRPGRRVPPSRLPLPPAQRGAHWQKGTLKKLARLPGHLHPRREGGPLWRAYAVLADGGEWIVPGVSQDPEKVRTAALADRPFGQVPVDARVERCPACCDCDTAAAIFGDYCARCAPDE